MGLQVGVLHATVSYDLEIPPIAMPMKVKVHSSCCDRIRCSLVTLMFCVVNGQKPYIYPNIRRDGPSIKMEGETDNLKKGERFVCKTESLQWNGDCQILYTSRRELH